MAAFVCRPNDLLLVIAQSRPSTPAFLFVGLANKCLVAIIGRYRESSIVRQVSGRLIELSTSHPVLGLF
jgi:hypothetical protein